MPRDRHAPHLHGARGAPAEYPGASQQEEIPPLDGVTLVPTFSRRPLDREAPLFFKYRHGRAIRDGEWKLVPYGKKPWELYRFTEDRTETTDLSRAHPDRAAAMKRTWKEWHGTR